MGPRTRRARSGFLTLAAAAAVLATAATALAGDGLDAVRSATARFHRLEVARDAGYELFTDAAGLACIEDPGGEGAMGVHYVKGALVGDGVVDARRPEALIYAPGPGRHRLVAVEYVVFVDDWEGTDPPSLFGHQFTLVGTPNRYGLPPFYELHAWVWRHNPNGTFEDWNPEVSCS